MKTRPDRLAHKPATLPPHARHTGQQQPDPFGTGCSDMALQLHEAERRLYARGAIGAGAYCIVSGIVRIERVTEAGCRRIIRVAGQGDLIGQEALLRLAYRDDAVACTPVALRAVPTAWLDDAGRIDEGLPLALMSSWQHALDESEFWSTEVTTGPARRRVLQLLARLQRHRDDEGRVWCPKRDQIGDMLNITVETCSRMISALRREGVVELLPPRHARLDDQRLNRALIESNH